MSTKPADRPILFSAPMVRALLAGTKTQTRRRLDAWTDEPLAYVEAGTIEALDPDDLPYRWPRTHAVGDRLWVREAHALLPRTAYRMSVGTGTIAQREHPTDGYTAAVFREGFDRSGRPRWRPSIHMPRWASRLTLTVTDVRVERLQDICEADGIAEGIERLHHGWFPYGISTFMTTVVDGREVPAQCCRTANDSYRMLWDMINGPDSWEANPWVAAYTFTVEHRNIDEVPARPRSTSAATSPRTARSASVWKISNGPCRFGLHCRTGRRRSPRPPPPSTAGRNSSAKSSTRITGCISAARTKTRRSRSLSTRAATNDHCGCSST
jgi:hypothetical protein